MSEWKRIDSIADVRRGASPRPIGDPKYFGGEVGWVRISDVTRSSRFLRETEQYLSPVGEALSVRVNPGDLVMSICGTLGRPIMIDMPACIHDGFVQFTNLRNADTAFLFYALQHAEAAFCGMGQPGTQTNLNTSLVGRHTIFCPSLSEQRHIAEILSTLDEAIEQTEALIAKMQQVKAGLMHDLFTRGVTPDGRLRPTREQAPELYKESPLGWIPREWEVRLITEVFDIQLGKMLNKLAKTGKWSAPYLGNRAVQWDFVDCSEIEVMDFTPSERVKFSLMPGDLLVCEGGDVGRTAIWRGEMEECFYQKAIHRLRPKPGAALPAFMLRFMRFAKENGYFREFTSQSSIAHLTQEKLGAIPMLLPKSVEQVKIAQRFDVIDSRIQGELSLLTNFRQQKNGLMHDLLTGSVRVSEDNEFLARGGSQQYKTVSKT